MRKTLAIELGKLGVTADAIALGFISTAKTEATAVAPGISFEELTRAYLREIPVGRRA